MYKRQVFEGALGDRRDMILGHEAVGEVVEVGALVRDFRPIHLLQTLEKEERLATPEEQEILSRYVGWGGIPQAFEENNSSWANEYLELKNTLSPEEYLSLIHI